MPGILYRWMDRSNRRPSAPQSIAREVARALFRTLVFGSFLAFSLYLRSGESNPGNRTFLAIMAAGCGVMLVWGLIESWFDVAFILRRRRGRY